MEELISPSSAMEKLHVYMQVWLSFLNRQHPATSETSGNDLVK